MFFNSMEGLSNQSKVAPKWHLNVYEIFIFSIKNEQVHLQKISKQQITFKHSQLFLFGFLLTFVLIQMALPWATKQFHICETDSIFQVVISLCHCMVMFGS